LAPVGRGQVYYIKVLRSGRRVLNINVLPKNLEYHRIDTFADVKSIILKFLGQKTWKINGVGWIENFNIIDLALGKNDRNAVWAPKKQQTGNRVGYCLLM